jgi:hypothetical protein
LKVETYSLSMKRLTKSSFVVSFSQIEKALAKVQLLDRKIGVKEMEHGARIGEYKKEVEGLEKEIEM